MNAQIGVTGVVQTDQNMTRNIEMFLGLILLFLVCCPVGCQDHNSAEYLEDKAL